MSDNERSPKPLRDPAAPRPYGSSIHGFDGNNFGKNFTTRTTMAIAPSSPPADCYLELPWQEYWRMQVILLKLKKLRKKLKSLKEKQVSRSKLKTTHKDPKELQKELKREVSCWTKRLIYNEMK